MVIRLYAALLALIAACSFDERGFGDRLCTGDQDCPRPDQACILNTCTQKTCDEPAACGADYQYACSSGGCVAHACADSTECSVGYACNGGFCQASFNVESAASIAHRSITVTFDGPPDAAAATTLANYTVSGLTLSGTPALSGNTVTLATSPQTATGYTVTVTNVTRAADGAPLTAASASFTGRPAFDVSAATATSSTTMLVVFNGAPDPATATTLANYSVAGLTLSGTPLLSGNTVTLQTSPQAATTYTVAVTGVRRASDAEDLTVTTAEFVGRTDFNLTTAVALDSHTLEVHFDAPPNAAQATTLAAYVIPGLTLSGTPVLSGDTVTLTTSAQAAQSYTVTVTGVTRASDGESLTVAAATFTGIAPFDVIGAAAVDTATVTVTFDAPPDPVEAGKIENYAIPGLTLGTPVLAGNTVTLTTSEQAAQTYTITVSNVVRASDGEPLTVASSSFTGRAAFKVLGAIALSSTQVRVTFDAAPNPAQAMLLASYSIPGLTLSGTPAVAGTTVTLDTSPQSATTFTVTVMGVSRASDGEPLTSATAAFTGRPPFNVTSAVSLTSTSIQLAFDAAPNAAQATTLSNYAIAGLALGGAPVLVGNTVTLTTSPQTAQTYAVVVSNVRRASDAEALTINSASFTGRPPFDITAAASTSNVSMTVTFSAPPDPVQATTLANYGVPGLTLSGTPQLAGNTVTIATSAQVVQSYTVTVANVARASDGEALTTTAASFTGRTGFNVTSAASVNTTTMSVTFDAAPDPGDAGVLANYSVPGLTLSGTPVLNGDTVTITTSPQAAQSYTVTVANVRRASDLSPLAIDTASFTHVSFNVASAASVTSRSFRVTFDAPPNAVQATTLANYSVPGLTLSGTPLLDGSTVTLTTSSQAALDYTVTVNNVTRASDGTVLTVKAAPFTGRTPFDVTGATATSSASISVTFSAPPTPAQATTLASYSVPGLTLTGTPLLSGNTVTLQTSPQTATTYTVTVAGVTRASDSEPLTTTNASFTGIAVAAPTVTNVVVQGTSPNNGTTFYNTGTATVVITGTDFASVSCPTGVRLDDTNGAGAAVNTPATSCTVDSNTQITATFPAGIRTNGALGWNVKVTNSVDTNATSAVKLRPVAGLVISEVQLGRGGAGGSTHEFIELYNPTGQAISLGSLGVQVHLRGTNGTDTTLVLSFRAPAPQHSSIPSHGFLLIASSTSDAADAWFAERDATYDPANGELVADGGAYVSLSTTAQAKVLDKVGWGNQAAAGREGTATADLSNNTSIQREPANGAGATTDTDDNSADFLAPTTSTTPLGTSAPPQP